MMNKILCLTACILSLTFSKAEDIDNSYQCNDLYEYDASVKGEVTSPFYHDRQRYHDGLWCEYRIRGPEGHRIKITFKDLDIVPSSGCFQDQLVVYSKDKKSVLGTFCGSELPYPLLSLEGENEIRLLFLTDFMAAGRGFVLQYESGPNLELCNSTRYTECKNRNCYDNGKKCDGVDDCGDGTDEENCGFPLVVEPELCGVPPITPNTIFGGFDRMVGGETVIPNSWPWQVSLQTVWSEPNGHFCGGTLINAQWVVTATHCVAGTYPENVKIHIGAHNKFTKTKYEQVRKAIKIIAYPDLEFENMRRYSMTHDISLIKLNAPVKFNEGVQPACLPQLGWNVKLGWSCYATGWGESRGTGGSDVLKQMEQVVQSRQNCGYNEDTQICVAKENNSPCHGDSGGPLVCRLGDRWYVFGAASFVTTTNYLSGLCTGPGAKTVYANVADKADWIRKIVSANS